MAKYISIEEKLLFASGSWQVDSRGVDALSKLSNALASQQEINVNIEGHTDSIPFGGRGQIKDNWDLSVVRATAIVKTLTSSSSISPERLSASGRGEYFPIASNKTVEVDALTDESKYYHQNQMTCTNYLTIKKKTIA